MKSTQDKDDARINVLSLTESGHGFLEKIRRAADEQYGRALAGISKGEMRAFLSLFEKFLGLSGPATQVLQPRIEVKPFSKQADLETARVFLIEQLVRRKIERIKSPALLRPESICLGLFVDDDLKGVIEVDALSAQCLHFSLDSDYEEGQIEQNFLKSSLKICFSKHSCAATAFPAEWGLLQRHRIRAQRGPPGFLLVTRSDFE